MHEIFYEDNICYIKTKYGNFLYSEMNSLGGMFLQYCWLRDNQLEKFNSQMIKWLKNEGAIEQKYGAWIRNYIYEKIWSDILEHKLIMRILSGDNNI